MVTDFLIWVQIRVLIWDGVASGFGVIFGIRIGFGFGFDVQVLVIETRVRFLSGSYLQSSNTMEHPKPNFKISKFSFPHSYRFFGNSISSSSFSLGLSLCSNSCSESGSGSTAQGTTVRN